MSSTQPRDPFVLIVDDEDQEAFAELIRARGVSAAALFPDDVDDDSLSGATVVLLDQYLDRWPGRDSKNLPVTLRVADGLALSAVLRSHVEGSARVNGGTGANPVAFALRTGELDRIGAGLPQGAREHLLAGQYNLEWVFDKKAAASSIVPSTAARVAALARAVADLPSSWEGESFEAATGWLSLPHSDWKDDALWQIEQCRPPRHAVAERTAGGAWLKWFLHRILPFPTFLLDRAHVALALGMHVDVFDEVTASANPLADRLAGLQYQGHLAEFMGRRWWRAGIGHLIDDLVGEKIDDLDALPRELKNLNGGEFEFLSLERPVLRIDVDYGTYSDPIDVDDAVRLQPDGWPPYADEVWASKADIVVPDGDPELRAMVVLADRWKMPSAPIE